MLKIAIRTIIPAAVFLLAASPTLLAQEKGFNHGDALLIHFYYSGHVPAGDMADRFGGSFMPGAGIDYQTDKGNLILGAEFGYLFGGTVKEDVLAPIRTPEGYIIGEQGGYSDIQLRERGIYLGGHVGKLFPVSEKNHRSGIRVTLGAGVLQHKIRVQDDPSQKAPQLADDYKKGYDRLSNGLALRQFIGYQHLGNEGRINFYAGLDLVQGFTQNRRSYNFDAFAQDTAKRTDLLIGIRVGWTLPFYIGRDPSEIYY